MSAANWTEGHPEELARQILGAVGRDERGLGVKNHTAYVKVRWLTMAELTCLTWQPGADEYLFHNTPASSLHTLLSTMHTSY
jgi:hypothetical protein